MRADSATETFCRVSIESPEGLAGLWRGSRGPLQGTCPFVLPLWLNAWWGVFGEGARSLIAVVRQDEAIAGIAPLMAEGDTVRFMGDPEFCDYFDCIVAPDKERLFFTALLAHLAAQGFKNLDLGPVRPESVVSKFFSEGEPPRGAAYRESPAGVVLEADLPGSWEEFLNGLSGKDRHELRRKFRRLCQTGSVHQTGSVRQGELVHSVHDAGLVHQTDSVCSVRRTESACSVHQAGSVWFRCVDDVAQTPEAMEVFLRLFTKNRRDKAEFMTDRTASFFRALAVGLAEEGFLKLFVLDVDEQPAASVFCFDYLGTRYLYNNGYDDAYRELSVGLLGKALSLRAAIDDGLGVYSFLKGGELYKRRLGGIEIPLTRWHVALS